MKCDVFISYKSEEYNHAKSVKVQLEKNGINCWMAPESIPGGTSYLQEIPKGIRSCRIFLLILSKASQCSDWVEKEFGFAKKLGKNVKPYMIEEFTLDDKFSFALNNVQIYYGYREETELVRMIEEIKSDIKNQSDSNENETLDVNSYIVSKTDNEHIKVLLLEEQKDNFELCSQPPNAILLGKAYEMGICVDCDFEKALYYYNAAGFYNDTKAKFFEAKLKLENNIETEKLHEQIEQVIISADAGDEDACVYLGEMYYAGKKLEQSYENAVKYWKMAELKNNAEARYSLSFCYAYGKGVPVNYMTAKMLAEKANQQEYPRAARILGHIYYEGLGCEQDLSQAIKYYKLAVERGDYYSQVNLGDLYYWSKEDYNESFIYYSLAAENGIPSGMYNLAWAYYSGKGTKKNPEKALKWFLKATENEYEKAKGMLLNAVEALEGCDDKRKVELYEKLYNLGCYDVCGRLAFAYFGYLYKGTVELDGEKAFDILEKGFEQRDEISMYFLPKVCCTVVKTNCICDRKNREYAIAKYKEAFSFWKEHPLERDNFRFVESCFLYACELSLSEKSTSYEKNFALEYIEKSLNISNRFFSGYISMLKAFAGTIDSFEQKDRYFAGELLSVLGQPYLSQVKLSDENTEDFQKDTYNNNLCVLVDACNQILDFYIAKNSFDDTSYWGKKIISLSKRIGDDNKLYRNTVEKLLKCFPENNKLGWIGEDIDLYGEQLKDVVDSCIISKKSKYYDFVRKNNGNLCTSHRLKEQYFSEQFREKGYLTVKQNNQNSLDCDVNVESFFGETIYFNKKIRLEFDVCNNNFEYFYVSLNFWSIRISDFKKIKFDEQNEKTRHCKIIFDDYVSALLQKEPDKIKLVNNVRFVSYFDCIKDSSKDGEIEISNVIIYR